MRHLIALAFVGCAYAPPIRPDRLAIDRSYIESQRDACHARGWNWSAWGCFKPK